MCAFLSDNIYYSCKIVHNEIFKIEQNAHSIFGFPIYFIIDKKPSGKSKDEQMAEKKQELEKRLQDVTGQLGTAKKAAKKGLYELIIYG